MASCSSVMIHPRTYCFTVKVGSVINSYPNQLFVVFIWQYEIRYVLYSGANYLYTALLLWRLLWCLMQFPAPKIRTMWTAKNTFCFCVRLFG